MLRNSKQITVNKQNMKFEQLPTDLQSLICDFAWKTDLPCVRSSLKTILMLKTLKLPCNFYHGMVWSWAEQRYMSNPLVVFFPVSDFNILFNGSRIRNILFQLDFRKRAVKHCGTRVNWLEKFDICWTFYVQFAIFYRILEKLPSNPYCPTYTKELSRSGSRFWSSGFPMGLL